MAQSAALGGVAAGRAATVHFATQARRDGTPPLTPPDPCRNIEDPPNALDGWCELMPEDQDRWTFLTNHAHVLLCLAKDPGIRLSDVATEVGLTERGVQRIVKELTASGYVTRERDGRRNRYWVDHRQPLRRAIARHRQVGDLLRMVTADLPSFDSGVGEGRDSTRIVSGGASRGWGEVVANQEPSAGSTSGARGEGTVGQPRYGAA